VRHCCLWKRTIAPSQHLPPWRRERSGQVVDGCYAACLRDCAGRLSREHYISENLLIRLNDSGRLRVQGFPWQRADASERIPPGALAARILCERHNSDLGALDEVATLLVDRLERVGLEFLAGERGDWVWLVNGHDVERWLLKVLVGLVLVGAARRDGGQSLGTQIPVTWVRCLFGEFSFPSTGGLHVSARLGDQFRATSGSFAFAPIHARGATAGLRAVLGGMVLMLATCDVPEGATGLLASTVRRPAAMAWEHAGVTKTVALHWDEPSTRATVNLTWSPPTDGATEP
jgi:hypothetical protein